ncbi:nucleotidyltransferase domain-containing protein [Thermomicrobium sp.]|uniref:nucleotidyltransferase domain-containing protein n=1 Tax=Thermomicrobium sp. TaxID=1969469 RepID=UPI00257D1802|nr:nucleotidyltransferase domain-containing protein [Thermomicrobium sp.]
MPVRSSTSSVLRWPDRAAVLAAVERWARELELPGLVAVGVFGSYARGDWGVGSDVDLVVIVERSARPPIERPLDLPLEKLPVPAEAIVYTREEWERLPETSPHFAAVLAREAVWVFGRPDRLAGSGPEEALPPPGRADQRTDELA